MCGLEDGEYGEDEQKAHYDWIQCHGRDTACPGVGTEVNLTASVATLTLDPVLPENAPPPVLQLVGSRTEAFRPDALNNALRRHPVPSKSEKPRNPSSSENRPGKQRLTLGLPVTSFGAAQVTHVCCANC
jgi:hypothetical protein